MNTPETATDQRKHTLRSHPMGSKIAYFYPRVAEFGLPLVYNTLTRAALGRQPLASAKAPTLADRSEILSCAWATVQVEDGFAIVGPTGGCFARAKSMTALLPWVAGFAAHVDGSW